MKIKHKFKKVSSLLIILINELSLFRDGIKQERNLNIQPASSVRGKLSQDFHDHADCICCTLSTLSKKYSVWDVFDFKNSSRIFMRCFTVLPFMRAISDILFAIATFQLYIAIKANSISKLKIFIYIMIGMITFRLLYAAMMLILDSNGEC